MAVIQTRNRLRIVHFVTEDYGPDVANGVARSIFHLNQAMRRLGHDATIVRHDAEDDHAIRPSARRHRSLRHQVAKSMCHVPSSLQTMLLEMKPDFVHLHSIHVPENVGVAATVARAGIPYCVTVQGGLSPVARKRRRLRKWTFRVLWEQRYLDSAAFIHAVSDQEGGELKDYGLRAPIVVAPNGVDVDALPNADDPDLLWTRVPELKGRRIFMFVGRLDPNQKGLDVLIEAFASVRDNQAALVLVGPDWKSGRATLEQLAARSGVADRIMFLGPSYGVEQANLMAGADVFVHTSRWEGLSLAVLEAAARGKPCLLTHRADPMNRLETHRAAVVVDTTVEGISKGLEDMMAMSRGQLAEMGGRAQQVVAQTFNWGQTATQLVHAYEQFRAPRTSVGAVA